MKKAKINTRIVTETTTTLLESDDIISCNRRDNGVTVYLDSAKSYSKKVFEVNKIDSSSSQVTIVAQAEETIGKENSFVISSLFGSIKFKTQGKKGWEIVSTDPINGGGGINLDKLSENAIPFKNNEGDLVDSGFELEEKMIISSKDLELPPNTLHLGTNISLHENGGFVEYHTNTLDKNYILLEYENNLRDGTSPPMYYKRDPLEEKFIFQADESNILKDIKKFMVKSPNDSEISKLYFKIADIEGVHSPSNVRIAILVNGNAVAYYPSKFAFENPMEGLGYGLSNGENEIELIPHFSFLSAYGGMTFELMNDGPNGETPINLLGSNNLPYMACNRNVITGIPLGEDSGLIKYFGDRLRIRANKGTFFLENLTNDEEGQEVWKFFSAIDDRRTLTKSLYLVNDEINKDRPTRLILHGDRVELKDSDGNVINPECDIPTFEIKALGGACGVCLIDNNGLPIVINRDGLVNELALKKDIGNAEWDGVIDLVEGENIHILYNEQLEEVKANTSGIMYNERVMTTKTVSSMFYVDAKCTCDIVCDYENSNVHSGFDSIKVNGTMLNRGINEGIKLVRGDNILEVVATGTAYSMDGGDTWKSGSTVAVNISGMPNSKIERDLFIKGKINPVFLN